MISQLNFMTGIKLSFYQYQAKLELTCELCVQLDCSLTEKLLAAALPRVSISCDQESFNY